MVQSSAQHTRGSAARRPIASPASDDSPLDQPVQFVRGVGPGRARILAGAGVQTVGDLIEYFPFRYEEQTPPQAIDTLMLDQQATVIGAVEQVRWKGLFRNAAVTATITDGSAKMYATWFNAGFLRDRLERGQVLRLFGQVGEYNSHAQMVNPRVEWLNPDDNPEKWNYGKIIPVYRAISGLQSGQIAKLVETGLKRGLKAVAEAIPEELRRERKLLDRAEAMRRMHFPERLDERQEARRRLAYEELLLMQLAVVLQRRFAETRARSPKMGCTAEIDRRIRRRFPFELTAAQDKVIDEIAADLDQERSMSRLLQGDVGSGKTVVALYAALVAIANKMQVAILAPTAVLAAQHHAGIEKYLAGSRVRRCLLTGKTTAGQREKTFKAIADGSMNLVVGTQALLEEKVKFHSLGLVIVDEQHKFGVSQRATLRGQKTPDRDTGRWMIPHYLVMTATPIPRTLSMTVFGDLDVSVIDALPPGRQPIETRLIRQEDEHDAWQEVRRRIKAGQQAYIVYPLVEESETLDLKAASVEVEHVANDLLPGARVGLLHGRLQKGEKQRVMDDFSRGRIQVLVSTTVIEVGVDVPNATVMVIQHAERFGLSALHQLRGRVGRGDKPSICMLFSESQGENAGQRLSTLCETTDGFRIAEEDLRIRGPGELLGTRQHGWPEFRVANLAEDIELLMQARDDATDIIHKDAKLERPAYRLLRRELRRKFRDKVAFLDVG